MSNELLSVDGLSLRTEGFGVRTRTGRYNLPSKRGENLVLAGASGTQFVADKPFEEGAGTLDCWVIGARTEDVVVATNYQPDPSFVNGTNGYDLSGNGGIVEHDDFRAHTGTHSLRVTSTGGQPYGHNGYLMQDTSGWEYITVSAWVWVPSGNSGVPALRIGGSGVHSTTVQYDGPRDQWVPFIHMSPVTSGGGTAVQYLYGSGVAGESVWFDDVALVPGNRAYNFNGDSPSGDTLKYRWTGTPNDSPSERYLVSQLVIPETRQGKRQAFEDNIQRLMRLFTRPHRLSEIRAAQPDGSVRRALVEWREWSEPEVMAGGTRAEFTMSYTIPGVWWEDEEETIQSATAGSSLPKTLDLTSFSGMSGFIDDAVFTVAGPISNPRITDAETGAWVEYSGTVANGQTWVLDVAAATSKVGVNSVMAATTHAGSRKLLRIPNVFGLSETPRLVLSGAGGGAATNLTVAARRKWANG